MKRNAALDRKLQAEEEEEEEEKEEEMLG